MRSTSARMEAAFSPRHPLLCQLGILLQHVHGIGQIVIGEPPHLLCLGGGGFHRFHKERPAFSIRVMAAESCGSGRASFRAWEGVQLLLHLGQHGIHIVHTGMEGHFRFHHPGRADLFGPRQRPAQLRPAPPAVPTADRPEAQRTAPQMPAPPRSTAGRWASRVRMILLMGSSFSGSCAPCTFHNKSFSSGAQAFHELFTGLKSKCQTSRACAPAPLIGGISGKSARHSRQNPVRQFFLPDLP